jgi:peptidoglycan/LPS O-acetylase OafA/YrhL
MKYSRQIFGLGKVRFLLALMVVFSHIRIEFFVKLGWSPGSIGNYNSGSVAVVNFFAISGYVMVELWKKHYAPNQIKSLFFKTKIFYLDRLIRLFPQFLFYSFITLIFIVILNVHSNQWQNVDIAVLIHNLTMLPLGFNMFLNPQTLFIPQAWSLGLELTFYAVIPILLWNWNWKRIYSIAYLSMFMFLLPYFGIVNPFWYGYQLLPAIFFIFVVGISMGDPSTKRRRTYLFACRIFTGLLLLYLYLNVRLYEMQFNKEVLLGTFIATWIIPNISNKSTKSDEWFGNMSYGVFLNHVLIATLMEEFIPQLRGRLVGAIFLLMISVILSDISFDLVEKRCLVWRRRVRLMLKN